VSAFRIVLIVYTILFLQDVSKDYATAAFAKISLEFAVGGLLPSLSGRRGVQSLTSAGFEITGYDCRSPRAVT